MKNKKYLILIILSFNIVIPQTNNNITDIIDKIYDLEKNKDPKCYATANRLEDFMYGTPLSEDARNLKIEIQKELIYYIKEKGTLSGKENNSDKINKDHIEPIIKGLASYTTNKNGDYLYLLNSDNLTVLKRDFDHYTSVSYGYRSFLSVEQDLLFFTESDLLPFSDEALELANTYVNLVTLVTLQLADKKARDSNDFIISKKQLFDSWITVLNTTNNNKNITEIKYPSPNVNNNNKNYDNAVVKEIIKQKLSSYEKYNGLSESVFLRNVQVFFARQKWPTDSKLSNGLRTYYLESLIQFTNSLITLSNENALESNNNIIRVSNVQSSLNYFLPSHTNFFEDVEFFPNNILNKNTLESYDLDSFRDTGFHWRILGYSLDDLMNENIHDIDPNAAEQLVEGIAQMGVLVLRIAGEYSRQLEKTVLDINDISMGFQHIQQLINTYDYSSNKNIHTTVYSSNGISDQKLNGFDIVTNNSGISFTHKSSDWLNRLIRGYTISQEEGLIKLAIPPAFGGSGTACEDINNDGLMDVLLLGGFGNKLYLNAGKNTFIDITESCGIDTWNEELNSYSEVRQPIIVDFDNDGLQDIFISLVNEQHKIYKNIDGRTFSDVSSIADLGGENLVAGPATAFDFDNDGLIDIFIGYFGNYIDGTLPTLSRDNQNGLPNKLFRNLGNFEFEEFQFTDDEKSNTGWTQAIGHTDINQDGLQDIIVGNDFGKNKYYLNNKNGTFTEASSELGTDKPSYTMNVGISDINGDMFPDLYISNIVVMQKDEKYVSPNEDTEMKFDPKKMANIRTIEANDLFLSSNTDDSLSTFNLSTAVGRGHSATGWSWDADFFDFDNDGDEDLYCVNGMNDFSVYSSENPFYYERAEASKSIKYAESSREKNVFFVNDDGQLINKADTLGADLNSNARSASYFDYDNDGDLDIIINNYHEEATLLENKLSNNNNWIKVRLVGNPKFQVNRDAIGSTLILNSKNNKNIWREIHSTTGYLSVHPKEQHFGLGNDQKTTIEIRWSNGEIKKIRNLKANSAYQITYPNIVEQIM